VAKELSRWEKKWWERRQAAVKAQQELRNKIIKQDGASQEQIKLYLEADWDFIQAEQEDLEAMQREFYKTRQLLEDLALNPPEVTGRYVTVPIRTRREPDGTVSRSDDTSLDRGLFVRLFSQAVSRPRRGDLFDARICPRCGLRVDIYAHCAGYPVGDSRGMMPSESEPVSKMEFDPDTVVDGTVDVRQLEAGTDERQ